MGAYGNTSFFWSHNVGKRISDSDWFDGCEELSFETSTIRCPKDWDSYLKKHFGDYRKLPPVEPQISGHGVGIIDTDRSYKYYQENGVDKT